MNKQVKQELTMGGDNENGRFEKAYQASHTMQEFEIAFGKNALTKKFLEMGSKLFYRLNGEPIEWNSLSEKIQTAVNQIAEKGDTDIDVCVDYIGKKETKKGVVYTYRYHTSFLCGPIQDARGSSHPGTQKNYFVAEVVTDKEGDIIKTDHKDEGYVQV